MAHDVAGTLLGRRDVVFGTAILGANYAADGGGESHTYSASSTFDFGYGGDLLLGLIDSQQAGFAGGLGFQSMEFTIIANGVEILDSTFRSLAVAESFFHDSVIDLGSNLGPGIDLTFGYNLVADGSGGFGFDFAVGGAVPESSTWAMMLIGFASIGLAAHIRSAKRRVALPSADDPAQAWLCAPACSTRTAVSIFSSPPLWAVRVIAPSWPSKPTATRT
jgi:hypothetical protein